MPEGEIAARGGATKWRTIKYPDGSFRRVAIVPKAGPRGGHTVAGPHYGPRKKPKRKPKAKLRLRRRDDAQGRD